MLTDPDCSESILRKDFFLLQGFLYMDYNMLIPMYYSRKNNYQNRNSWYLDFLLTRNMKKEIVSEKTKYHFKILNHFL